MAGVWLASLVIGSGPERSEHAARGALFHRARPIAGQFGWLFGIVAGFLHAAVVLVVGEPCGGYNLYNNGFSAGLVALVMVSLIQGFLRSWHQGDGRPH
jgi:hypothetical protein